MARKPRLWYPGATYHLMERGIRRQAIYSDYTDYQTFLAILKRSLKKYSCTLHAFCLMTNHFHLLLETSDTPVGSFMKHLACTYATYYNRKYSYLGHLFEGRYCSGLVKDDSYFLQTSRYIHLNPVKAQIVSYPEDYTWSSYRTFLGLADDKITVTNQTLSYFGKYGIQKYRDFVDTPGQKFKVSEQKIQKEMGENDLWLPW